MKKTNRSFKSFLTGLWAYLKKAKVEFLIIALAIASDLITKTIVQSNMTEGQTITVIPNFLNWHYTLNNKAGFGWAFGLENIMSDKGIMIFFIVLTFIALILFFALMYFVRNKRFIARLAVALIIGGAIGNLVDRLAFGYVRDFIQIVYFGLDLGCLGKTFAIFNLADSFLTVGMILFAIFIIFFFDDKDKNKVKVKSEREMTTAELNDINTEEETESGEKNEESDSSRDR